MINIGGMDFNTTGSFSIDQLHATNSSISMLNIGNIINTNITNNQTLTMSNSGYSNSTIQYSDNIINLKNIEIDSTLQLQIFNISMSGITFIRGGNLILFQQQTKSPMIVTNSLFQNIYGNTKWCDSGKQRRLLWHIFVSSIKQLCVYCSNWRTIFSFSNFNHLKLNYFEQRGLDKQLYCQSVNKVWSIMIYAERL